MKIYDISQSIPDCAVYPGDPLPETKKLFSIERGDMYNLTSFTMCAHNGTHIDAPYHFINEGKTVEKLPLTKMVGWALVVDIQDNITELNAWEIIKKAESYMPRAIKKILFRSGAILSAEGARVFADYGVELIGCESQTVGPEDAPLEVHKILLEKEVVILEGISLAHVPGGVYFLNSAPISIQYADGSPCRAILIEF